MTDISEKQTIEYFTQGLKKASSAANKAKVAWDGRVPWATIVMAIGQIMYNAKKIYEGKPQTRLETLVLADRAQKETVN